MPITLCNGILILWIFGNALPALAREGEHPSLSCRLYLSPHDWSLTGRRAVSQNIVVKLRNWEYCSRIGLSVGSHIAILSLKITTKWTRAMQSAWIPCRHSAVLGRYTAKEAARLSERGERKLKPISKIWGFHGGDYEECRLLGYKNSVRTSQEIHRVSATELSRWTLCKI
jgi:hypothetical protein